MHIADNLFPTIKNISVNWRYNEFEHKKTQSSYSNHHTEKMAEEQNRNTKSFSEIVELSESNRFFFIFASSNLYSVRILKLFQLFFCNYVSHE